jgi:hypothetical protein
MHIKDQAMKSRQSVLQKALSFGENSLRIAGTVKGIYDIGKEIYSFGQMAAPIVGAAAALL